MKAISVPLFLAAGFALMAGPTQAAGQDVATVEQARQVLDLTQFPLPAGSQLIHPRQLASLGFTSDAQASGALQYVRDRLKFQGWEELPGAVSGEQYAAASFSKDGFRVAATITMGTTSNRVNVSLNHLGNLQFKEIPVPAGVQLLFAGPATAIFLGDKSPDETASAVEATLLAAGWKRFGGTTNVRSYLKNAVLLNALISNSAAQEGKTSISFTSQLVSATYPMPAAAESIDYTDPLAQLSYSTPQTAAEILEFYRAALGELGWSQTSDQTMVIDLNETQVFRNEAGELLTVGVHPVDGASRVSVRRFSAEEVAQRAAERDPQQGGQPMNAAQTGLPKLELPQPSKATDLKVTPGRIEFQLPAGSARSALDLMLESLRKDSGLWSEERPFWDNSAGTAFFTRDNQSLSVLFTDSGELPAEVSVTFQGVEFRLK